MKGKDLHFSRKALPRKLETYESSIEKDLQEKILDNPHIVTFGWHIGISFCLYMNVCLYSHTLSCVNVHRYICMEMFLP